MLQDILQKLTGFSDINFSFDEALHEFHHKFGETIMLVNNELMHVRRVFTQVDKIGKISLSLDTNQGIIRDEHVFSLVPFKPDCGLYWLNDGNLVFFKKTAKKQFKKSFYYGENYDTAFFAPTGGQIDPYDDFIGLLSKIIVDTFSPVNKGIISANRQLAFVKGNILFMTKKIGTYETLNHNILECSIQEGFTQEVLDFIEKEAI